MQESTSGCCCALQVMLLRRWPQPVAPSGRPGNGLDWAAEAVRSRCQAVNLLLSLLELNGMRSRWLMRQRPEHATAMPGCRPARRNRGSF